MDMTNINYIKYYILYQVISWSYTKLKAELVDRKHWPLSDKEDISSCIYFSAL